ncbi:hypothetical protein FRB99_002994 [Tulasnella sp. 403]|nr:hypothetical protein FRB99_002994 [Tulasnella sp. 403]
MSEIVAILTGKSFKFAESWSMGVEKLEGLRFSRDGKVLALRYPTSIKIHNIRTGDLEYELIVPNDKDEHGVMEFSRSGLLLAASSGPDVMVWDLATRQIREIQSFGNHGAWALDISSDDTFCAVGNEDGMVYLWDIRNKAKTRSASLKNKVYSVAISPGCEIVAVATSLAGVHIQDVPTLATLATFDVGTIWSVRFSPDGHRLFGDSADHIARCWNIVNIKEWGVNERVRVTSGLEFRGHGDNISSVSGNSTWFLSVSYGGEVRAVNLVTDAASGKTQRIGSMPPTYNNRWVDLSPVSEEGTGYAATYHGSGDMVIWKYASLSYRNAHCF